MKRKCELCGELVNEFDMMTFNTGRVKYVCWDCYKNSQREANLSDRHRQQKLFKIKVSKSRHK